MKILKKYIKFMEKGFNIGFTSGQKTQTFFKIYYPMFINMMNLVFDFCAIVVLIMVFVIYELYKEIVFILFFIHTILVLIAISRERFKKAKEFDF